MKSTPKELTFEIAGTAEPFARLCIEATLYWRGSMYAQPGKLAAAYAKALERVKSDIAWFESGSMSGAKKLKADSLDMVPFWLTKAKRREDIYIMLLKGGAKANEPSDTGLYFFADEEEEPAAGGLSVILPCTAAEQPEALVRLMEDIAACADFESGHCGYSVSWDPNGDGASDAKQRMLQIAGRFAGVDLPKMNTTVSALRRSSIAVMKTAQWLTYLGEPLVNRIGGAETATSLLKPFATVTNAGKGLLVRSSNGPLVGDVNRQDDISGLRSVGKALGGLRVANHGPIFGTRDQTNEWLARFD